MKSGKDVKRPIPPEWREYLLKQINNDLQIRPNEKFEMIVDENPVKVSTIEFVADGMSQNCATSHLNDVLEKCRYMRFEDEKDTLENPRRKITANKLTQLKNRLTEKFNTFYREANDRGVFVVIDDVYKPALSMFEDVDLGEQPDWKTLVDRTSGAMERENECAYILKWVQKKIAKGVVPRLTSKQAKKIRNGASIEEAKKLLIGNVMVAKVDKKKEAKLKKVTKKA